MGERLRLHHIPLRDLKVLKLIALGWAIGS